MKAAVLYEPMTRFIVEEVDIKSPESGEVLVKLVSSGVCHSDWHIVKGEWDSEAGYFTLPSVLGHEGAGVVEEVGEGVTSVIPGDHVILNWAPSCGQCEMCYKGWPNLCMQPPEIASKMTIKSTGEVVHPLWGLGTFATHTVVPEVAVVRIDDDVPFDQAALVGCGVTTGVGAAINTAQVQPGTSTAVFGCGGVGLSCIQGCVIAGASVVIAVDLLDSKLELAKEFGATHTVNASREDPVQRIKELTTGEGVHYSFEAIGLVEAPFVQSIRCTRRRGVTVWVGHAPIGTTVTLDARDLMDEKIVMGSMYGTSRPKLDFPRLLDLYKTGKLKLDELVSRRFTLEEIDKSFEVLAEGDVARSVLTFE